MLHQPGLAIGSAIALRIALVDGMAFSQVKALQGLEIAVRTLLVWKAFGKPHQFPILVADLVGWRQFRLIHRRIFQTLANTSILTTAVLAHVRLAVQILAVRLFRTCTTCFCTASQHGLFRSLLYPRTKLTFLNEPERQGWSRAVDLVGDLKQWALCGEVIYA